MKLKDYYKNVVHMNENKTGGWAPNYYGVFSNIIEQNNYKIIAEVGIGYGTHAKYILNNNPNIEKLYLIDPVCYYPNDAFAADIMSKESEQDGNNFNELYDLIRNELKPWDNKYVFFRNKSLDITPDQIPDESLDAVFVDGAHDYDNVFADLNFWIKKIRKGGQMLGDDYIMDDVKRAVNDFSNLNNINYDLLTLETTKYPIFRIKKY
jgi:hypothetical protein